MKLKTKLSNVVRPLAPPEPEPDRIGAIEAKLDALLARKPQVVEHRVEVEKPVVVEKVVEVNRKPKAFEFSVQRGDWGWIDTVEALDKETGKPYYTFVVERGTWNEVVNINAVPAVKE